MSVSIGLSFEALDDLCYLKWGPHLLVLSLIFCHPSIAGCGL